MLKKGLAMIIVLFSMKIGYSMTSFDEAMGEGYHPQYYRNSKKLKKSYESYHFEKTPYSERPLIPKKIHQIWIGGEVPERFKKLMATWKKMHPDWEYILWTDREIEAFAFENKELFFSTDNMGSKSDIWRYEILYQQGGVYVDVDFECTQPFDVLVHHHLFFTGIGGFDYINNAIIGSCPFHPMLKKIIRVLHSTPKEHLNMPWYNTGPLFFTKQVYAYLKDHPEEGVVYPVRFFYPLPNTYRHAYWKGELSQESVRSFFIPETFGVHYWAESWR